MFELPVSVIVFTLVAGIYFLLVNITSFLIKFLRWVHLHFICKIGTEDLPKTFGKWAELCPCKNLPRHYGQWAVVTGGTDGIGKAYARELARRGVNIVIISRNMAKLISVAKEIEEDFKVETKIIQKDFSEAGKSYESIGIQLRDMDIGILVNNVGVIVPYPLVVSEMTEAQIWDHVNVNIGATTLMTRLLLPGMMLRRRGVIVNLSSLSAVAPTPYLNVYASTKAYIDNFSEALRFECRGTGVTVQTLCPGYVNTQMLKFSDKLRSGGLLVPSADLYAKHAVSTLQVSGKTSGYWAHDVQYWICLLMPHWMWINIAGYVNIFFRNKYERSQKLKQGQV